MSDAEKLLQQLPARSVGRILSVVLIARQQGKQVPYTLFHLASGQTIAGWLVDMQEDEGIVWALVHTSEDVRSPSTDVSYISLQSVSAITLKYVGNLLPELSFGMISIPVGAEIPSRLELQRKLQKLQERFPQLQVTVAWEAMPETAPSHYHLGQLLNILPVVLDDIYRSDMGREAMTATVREIKLSYGQEESVTRSNHGISIVFNTAPRIDELASAMQKLL